jgi:DDE superfamily endonuclease
MFAGISKSSFYRVCWHTIFLLYDSDHLQITFAQSMDECQEAAARGFASISQGEAIVNCVGAIDGYLLHTEAPPKSLVENMKSYFSGHYQRYGVNVQACCDHLSRFTYIAVAGPSVMNNNQAINEVDLAALIGNLPFTYCVIGDAAYTATEHLIPMFYGPRYDNFNFYASQLRIRIEMAFGMMQKKWKSFGSPSLSLWTKPNMLSR